MTKKFNVNVLEWPQMSGSPDGTVMKFDGEYLDEIKTQIFTDSLRSHRWVQMGENLFNANGREFSQIRTGSTNDLKARSRTASLRLTPPRATTAARVHRVRMRGLTDVPASRDP